jgi:glucosamine-6-phosphate deaminase
MNTHTTPTAPNPPLDTPEARQRERIPAEIFASADDAARVLAREIATLVAGRAAAGRGVVLGLATGSTPVRLYRELIRIHREERLSFANVTTFNLDEYYGIPGGHPQSYHRFMRDQLFDHLDIPEAQIHIPSGTVPRAGLFAWCAAYEEKIRAAGGLDLQILGIGRTGHIGFNEPGSTRVSRTRLVTLDSLTRADAARDFLGESNVPRHAVTMGVGTILDARRVALLAWGAGKAAIIARAIEEAPGESIPASLLQHHPDCRFYLDGTAAAALTRVRRPWLVSAVGWTPALARRAVAGLSQEIGKPVLKLLDGDYNEHGLADLLSSEHAAYDINIRVFNELQHTITGWPGGKPCADDSHRPERAAPAVKRVLVLTPEPMDAVLGMGGTLRRLVDQGHTVTVAQMTSGSLAVPDDDAALAAGLVLEFSHGSAAASASVFSAPNSSPRKSGLAPIAYQEPIPGSPAAHAAALVQELESKPAFATDSASARRIKVVIRRGEARASFRACGVAPASVRFLDLPFYENGQYRRFNPGAEDVVPVVALLREIRPHQVFVTGRDDDPSGVAAVCHGIFCRALAETEGEAWRASCRFWHYQTPGVHPAEPAAVDMSVPLSPGQLREKIQAVLQHRSQRGQTPGEGEAWHQAEAADRALAVAYDSLGLANYEAIESFTRLRALE